MAWCSTSIIYGLFPNCCSNKRNKAYVLSNVAFCIGMLFFTHLWFELVNAYFTVLPSSQKQYGILGLPVVPSARLHSVRTDCTLAATIRMSKKWHEAELGTKAELKRIERPN